MKATLLTTVVAALLLGNLAPAAAETYQGTDARGDVESITVGTPARAGDDTPRHPHRALGDIVAIRVNHTESTVRIRLRLRELVRAGGPHEWWFTVRVPEGENRIDYLVGV